MSHPTSSPEFTLVSEKMAARWNAWKRHGKSTPIGLSIFTSIPAWTACGRTRVSRICYGASAFPLQPFRRSRRSLSLRLKPDAPPQLSAVVHHAIGDDVFNLASIANVVERIAIQHNQVRTLSLLDRADFLFKPHDP